MIKFTKHYYNYIRILLGLSMVLNMLQLILLQIILIISYLINKVGVNPYPRRVIYLLIVSYFLYNNIKDTPTILIACTLFLCLKIINVLLGNTKTNLHKLFRVFYYIVIVFIIYKSIFPDTILLAEELKELDIDLQQKITIFCKIFTIYLEIIGVSKKDRKLFKENLIFNKRALYDSLEKLNTIEEIHTYVRSLIDKVLHRKMTDDRVSYLLEKAFLIYIYCVKISASKTMLLITFPKRSFEVVLKRLWEVIIKFLFGL